MEEQEPADLLLFGRLPVCIAYLFFAACSSSTMLQPIQKMKDEAGWRVNGSHSRQIC
jgi:hypothetical protein